MPWRKEYGYRSSTIARKSGNYHGNENFTQSGAGERIGCHDHNLTLDDDNTK